MKTSLILIVGFLFYFSSAQAKVADLIKHIDIAGQQYSCRPSNIEPPCPIKSDLGLPMGMAADSADAFVCITDGLEMTVSEKDKKQVIENCFLQRRIKAYSDKLSIMMVGRACWAEFYDKCIEDTLCPDNIDPQARCGYYGATRRELEKLGVDSLFTDADAARLCKSLID